MAFTSVIDLFPVQLTT